MVTAYTCTFTAQPEHIDELGHVNNAVWVQWIQDIAVSHWASTAKPEDVDAYFWVVTRHEIDYRGNVREGESVIARTWIPDPPHGAQFDRMVEFSDSKGKRLVTARSTWALIDRASGRLSRVPAQMAERFLVGD